MEFIPLLAGLALIAKVTDLVKFINAKDVGAVVTQVLSWAVGVVVFLLMAQTDFAGDITVGTLSLAQANFWSLLFIGVSVSSSASLAVDFKSAIDNTDSASTPSL